MSSEIKECPYCGGPAKLITVYAPEKSAGERYRYVCNGIYEEPTRLCPRHKTGTIEQAAEAWNTRAAPASAATERERAKRAFLAGWMRYDTASDVDIQRAHAEFDAWWPEVTP